MTITEDGGFVKLTNNTGAIIGHFPKGSLVFAPGPANDNSVIRIYSDTQRTNLIAQENISNITSPVSANYGALMTNINSFAGGDASLLLQ